VHASVRSTSGVRGYIRLVNELPNEIESELRIAYE